MDAREFDALISRIASSASRREAVRGVLGGALVSAGALMVADADAGSDHKGHGKGKKRKQGKGAGNGKARGKQRNSHKRVASEHNTRNGKRTLCICTDGGAATTVAPTSTSTTQGPKQGRPKKQARALVCETQRLKPKQAKNAMRDNPGSYRGPCKPDNTTLSPISSTSTSTSSTTSSSTSTSTTSTSTSTSTTSTSTSTTSTSTSTTTSGGTGGTGGAGGAGGAGGVGRAGVSRSTHPGSLIGLVNVPGPAGPAGL